MMTSKRWYQITDHGTVWAFTVVRVERGLLFLENGTRRRIESPQGRIYPTWGEALQDYQRRCEIQYKHAERQLAEAHHLSERKAVAI